MPELAYQFAGLLIGAGAVYGGIRADLKSMRESITRAHQRIDELLAKGGK